MESSLLYYGIPPFSGCRLLFFLLHAPVKAGQGVGQPSQVVDEPQLHRLLPVDNAAHVGGHLSGIEHKMLKVLSADAAVPGYKIADSVLNALEIVKGLAHSNNQAVEPHRVDSHGP